MKDKTQKLFDKLLKNKFVLILIAAGLVFMLFTTGEGKIKDEPKELELTETGFSLEYNEKRLGEALSKISGAGEVQVVLTVKSSTEQVIAEDRESTARQEGEDNESENAVKTVVVDSGSSESPVTLKYIYPEYQGALVIAQGAGDAAVRLKLTEAVESLTGIGADCITVVEMEL